MLGYRNKLFLGVTRIQSVFADGLNPPRTGSGTGFWMRLKSGRTCFVTNRHNIDPTVKFPNEPNLRLESASIELRQNSGANDVEPIYNFQTRYFELAEEGNEIIALDNADCAVILPKFKESTEGFSFCAAFAEEDLADEDFLKKTLRPVADVFFIGFAGRSADSVTGRQSSSWWDTKWNLPIARSAVIASVPFLDFNNSGIKTKDVLLVSGMSFSGSSGSPVISKEVGFLAKPPIKCGNHVPEKVIGIMSGHWWAEADYPEIFKHSGLSYFTCSSSILHLIRTNNL